MLKMDHFKSLIKEQQTCLMKELLTLYNKVLLVNALVNALNTENNSKAFLIFKSNVSVNII